MMMSHFWGSFLHINLYQKSAGSVCKWDIALEHIEILIILQFETKTYILICLGKKMVSTLFFSIQIRFQLYYHFNSTVQ